MASQNSWLISHRDVIGGPLADADEMIASCQQHKVVFAGGNLQRAKFTQQCRSKFMYSGSWLCGTGARHDVQHAARMLRSGQLGQVVGASVHGWQGEIVGGGCQHISVLRLLTDAEVTEVIGYFDPPMGLAWKAGPGSTLLPVDNNESEESLCVNAVFKMSSGITVAAFGTETPYRGVDVWTDKGALVRWYADQCKITP
eukprot:SAG31_NODE_3712_length_3957_cov_9.372041_2_plen_199_part_00